MTQVEWMRNQGVLLSSAAQARSEGREADALVYDVLAGLLRHSNDLELAKHDLEGKVATLQESLQRLTRKVLELESRVHEDVEG